MDALQQMRGRTYGEVHAERMVGLEETGKRPECTENTPRCFSAKTPLFPTRACCRRHVATVLHDVATAFDANGIRWFIDYGTLLGYMVNGGLYWNDKDTDLGVLAEDRDKVFALMDHWRSLGRNVSYSRPKTDRFRGGDRVKVRLSERNTTNCDIFFWAPNEEGVLDRQNYISVDRHKGREFPLDWAFPVTRGQWDGIDVAVPAEPEKLVVHRYGANWQNLPAARTDGVKR